jgi:hypothetical protein
MIVADAGHDSIGQLVSSAACASQGLLAAFPKLLGSGEEKQHTFIETDTVRWETGGS